jgi:predicted dehydrogenase
MTRTNRRTFLRQAAQTGVAAPAFLRNLISKPRNTSLWLASFGAGGMAYNTLDGIATHKKVELCTVAEVDSERLERVNKKYPNIQVYEDWRRMLDREHRNLDIACIGTPDHMHAPMAIAAMQLGLHAYVQKPLTHDIYETRRLTQMARRKRLVTQMGIQRHSSTEYRSAVSLIQSGVIGKIKEVHAWSEKKWGDPGGRPERTDSVPPTLLWDLWLGVAESRPFIADYYHPSNWRKRTDFGTATFGDMGCHIYDPVYESLRLTAPLTVRSEGPAPGRYNWAINSVIHYVFPGTRYTAGRTVNVTWYDGDQRPPKDVQAVLGGKELPGQGSIMIGTKGTVLLPHVGMPELFPQAQFKGFHVPVVEGSNHYHQFVDAILGNGKVSTPFDYAGPLTEAVLLGPIATRFPNTTLEWSASKMQFKSSPDAERYIHRKYRIGWQIKALM